jgi:hypothetical protein
MAIVLIIIIEKRKKYHEKEIKNKRLAPWSREDKKCIEST